MHVVPIAVLTKSKLVPLTVARQVTTTVSSNNVTRPRPAKTVVTKPHSPPRRNINRSPSPKASTFSLKVTAAKASMGNSQHALKDKGIIDSGCSRHMTGNMSYLSDFEEINGRYVAFGGNPKGGKIFGKSKIRTGKLDFDDVYFVKELKFNLFSVSRMCDKKNSLLFTDTKCIVLSPEFKLPDENQVLLRVPRENMYNVDLKNIVPSEDLTYLFAKATLDKSNLWHRRLGHINFKTMNKLVKGNLRCDMAKDVMFLVSRWWELKDRRHVRETITITSTQNTNGIVQAEKVEGVEKKPVSITPGHAEYMKQVVEDVGDDEDFNSGSCVGATGYVKANGGIVSVCLRDIKTFLKNEKLEQVVAIIKSCSPNALGDLKVTVKYLSVFFPKPSMHYLNVTKKNMVKVFHKNFVPEEMANLELHVCGNVIDQEDLYKFDKEALDLVLEEEARESRAHEEWLKKCRQQEEEDAEHERQLFVEAAFALEVDAMGALDLVEVEAVEALDLMEVEWEDLLDIDDSDLSLTPVLRPCNRHVRETITITSTQNTDGIVQVEKVEKKLVRTIPDPAGIVQLAKIRKQSDIHEGGDDFVLSTQEYMKQVVKDVGEDEDFNSGSWVGAIEYVKANGGIVSGCLGDIKTFLKNGKLEQVVAIIKSCSPNALGNLKVIVKDLSDTLAGSIHYKVINEKNMVNVFHKDFAPSNGSDVGGSEMLMEEEEIVKLVEEEEMADLELHVCGNVIDQEDLYKFDEEALDLVLEEEARESMVHEEWSEKCRQQEWEDAENERHLFGFHGTI
nr:ribonuclease H-like domain-containing protein [Tanacetum cinerariifolium]